MGCNPFNCSCGENRYCPLRYVVAVMSLTGLLVGYGHRVSLNIAITTMTNKTVSKSNSCPDKNYTTAPKHISGGVIPWSNSEQNYILGSLYPGYIIGHVPAGIYCDRHGARRIFLGGMILSTIMTLVTPIVVVNAPWYATAVLRSMMGLGQSVIFPAISALYARWIPFEERSVLGAFSFAASSIGIIFGNFFTGLIINLVGNWPIGFYLWGGLGIVWCIFFAIYVYSEPAWHPKMHPKEKELLDQKISKSRKDLKIPWKGFFSDLQIWAIIICSIGHDFTIFTLINNFPKYLSDVLKYDLQENAVASSLPYLCQWIGGLLAGELMDYLIKRKGASVIWCRRISTTVGMVLPGAFVLAAGYMGCNGTWVIVMFSFNLFFKGPLYAGMKINHLDLSINFAGIIMAFTNGIGALTGWISPFIINLLAGDNTLEQWQIIYWIVFGMTVVTNTFYVFTCGVKRRKWDVPENEMEEFLKQEEEKDAEIQRKKQEKKDKKDNAEEGPSK